MSRMHWKDLRDTDFDTLASLAALWASYVAAMTEQAEVISEDVTRKHLSVDNYESQTADDIRDQLGLVADGFQDDLHEYAMVKIKATLEDAHAALTAEQSEIAEVVAEIESRRFEITGVPEHYRVVLSEGLRRDIHNLEAPQWLLDRAGINVADIAASSDHLNQVIRSLETVAGETTGAYGDRLRAIMSRAHEADNTAAQVLTSIRDSPAELPPRLGATYDDLVDRYEKADAERDIEFLKEISGSPQRVNKWWDTLSDAERGELVEDHPELLGPTDGIPSEVRDSANRTLLDRELDRLDSRIKDLESRAETALGQVSPDENYADLMNRLHELRNRQDDLTGLQDRISGPNSDTGQDYYLLGYDSAEDGQAIVSIGNPDTADNINVYVPGTGSDIGSVDNGGGILDRADTMAYDAHEVARRSDTATVLWLGYDAPDNVLPFSGGGIKPEAAFESYARDAAGDLGSFTDGLRATGEPSNLTMTGHSYGSTTIGVAARDEGLDVDNMIFVGSPGVGVETASDLGIDPGNVWATRNEEDIIEFGMVHGTDPTSAGFGGRTFESDATRDGRINNHSSYWDEGNAARTNIAKIITGRTG